jgi:WD domain, G-beta repeat
VFVPHGRTLLDVDRRGPSPGIRARDGHRHWIRSVAVAADGDLVVSGAGDRTVGLWRRDDRPVELLRLHEDEVWTVAVTADGRRVASAGWDRAIAIWAPRDEGRPRRGQRFDERGQSGTDRGRPRVQHRTSRP